MMENTLNFKHGAGLAVSTQERGAIGGKNAFLL